MTLATENRSCPQENGCKASLCLVPSVRGLIVRVAVKNVRSDASLFGVLVGNKADYRSEGLSDSRVEIGVDDGQRMAQELGLAFFETSAVRTRSSCAQ